MKNTPQTTLVIFGISGDLSRRKILPPLIKLFEKNKLPEKFNLLGISRQNISLDDIFDNLLEDTDKDILSVFKDRCKILQIDVSKESDFEILKQKLELLSSIDENSQQIFYLSVPPQNLMLLIQNIGKIKSKNSKTKIIFEKPFGTNLSSAKILIEETSKFFDSSEVYHIDHYLTKQMVQNIFNWRKKYKEFEAILNKDNIDRIEISSIESIGIEGRVDFYEKTGALRDLIQSHLLEVSSQILRKLDKDRGEAIGLLKERGIAIRGQYDTYKEEVGNQSSTTETFAEITLLSNDSNWQGVPITLVTGKGLDHKESKVDLCLKNNIGTITFFIQPNIDIKYSGELDKPLILAIKNMKEEILEQENTNGHEIILLDTISGEKELFVDDKEIIESWKLVDSTLNKWKEDKDDLFIYNKGSTLENIRTKYENNKN